jgi:hypothetical protein
MEKMLEKRILNRGSGSGSLADPSRDVTFHQTNAAGALYQLVREAITQYSPTGAPRTLPITCTDIPDLIGVTTFSWPSYDLVPVWKAITDLAADGDGPDFRLEPVLTDTDDGPHVFWDLQIGAPALPASGNIGPTGPQPWTFSPVHGKITRQLDGADLATAVYATGGGQDRNKTIAAADSGSMLRRLGWPAIEVVNSPTSAGSTTATEQADNYATVFSHAESVATTSGTLANTVKLEMPADGTPDIGQIRRGDLARIDTRSSIYLDPGFELRRITQIDGGPGGATLSCERDPDLMEV